MGAPPRDHRPQYGWDRVTLLPSESLGEPGGVLPSTSTVVERPNGLYRVTVAGRCAGGDSSGTGRFGYVIEGSNTGGAADAEWVVLGQVNLAETYVAGAVDLQVRVLGFANGSSALGFNGEAQVNVDRWRFLRIRTFVSFEDGGDPVSFEISFRVTGIAADGQSTLNTSTLTRTSGDASEPVSDAILKPEGVRYVSIQAIVDDMILDPAPSDGFDLILQAAVNQSAVNNDQWVTFDILGNGTAGFTAAGDSGHFSNGQTRLIDLNGFQYFRFTAQKNTTGPNPTSTDLSSYTIRCIACYDDADWIDGEQGIPLLHENLRKMFGIVVFDPVVGPAPNVNIRMQLCDVNQQPILAARRVALLLADSQNGFTNDLNALATFTSVTAPAVLEYGAGSNVAVILTDDDGTATIQINLNAADPCFLYAWNEWIPFAPSDSNFGPGMIVVSTQRADVVP